MEQFDGITELSKDANVKLERILYGLYGHGPLEQLIHPRLYLGKLPENVEKKLSLKTPRLKEVLFQLRREGALFKNKYFFKGHRANLPWPGTIGHSSKLIYENQEDSHLSLFKGVEFARPPFSFANYFKSGASAVHILDDYFLYAILQGRNVKKGQGGQLVHWLQNDFNNIILNTDIWYNFISDTSFSFIDTSYFDITPYTVNEIRKLSLFYSVNFIHAPSMLPISNILHSMDKKQARRTPVMLNYHSKDTRNMHWSAFQKNYPDFLSKDHVSLASLLSELDHLTEDDFDIPWHDLPKYTQNRNIEILTPRQTEVLKVLSTANLLTVAADGFGTGRYIPLIGTQKECHVRRDRKLQPNSCPIVFLNSESKEALDSMKEFIQRRYLGQFCPLLTSGRLSLNFIEYMQNIMQLKIKDIGLKEYCSFSKNNNIFTHYPGGTPREYTIPSVFHEKILNDLFNMGKKSSVGTWTCDIGWADSI